MSKKRKGIFYKKLEDSSSVKWIKTDPKGSDSEEELDDSTSLSPYGPDPKPPRSVPPPSAPLNFNTNLLDLVEKNRDNSSSPTSEEERSDRHEQGL